ncbi:MAG: type II toxin-antitoxin system VapC family toxin [Candidatus Eremiobacteraeota bacterium]|nr:type II toxin-antitoxin system VapC family toxin [Candidatus Eremiobacteraeota bacterium]MCW5866521.1 type II toxin-antitoxin system VapC family toxin [Candidatus Eremiobacteraeota bacterium]
MRLLLDTHALLWAWTEPAKLSETARALIQEPSNTRWVSPVTGFEISQKYRLGKLQVEPGLVSNYTDHLRTFQAEELPLLSKHALYAGGLPGEHRDPFDRLLAAQSLLEGVPLLTADPAFLGFGVQTIW